MEDIIKFYKGGEPIIDEDIIKLIDILINESIEGNGTSPLKIERLNEMKDIVKNKLFKESSDDPEIQLSFKISTRNKSTAQGIKDLIIALEALGSWGCSREVKLYFDGDGHNRLKINELQVTGAELEDNKINSDMDIITIGSFD